MGLSTTSSRKKLLLLLLGSLLFVAVGAWIVRDPGADIVQVILGGWLSISFFGLCAIVLLAQFVLPKPRLTIDSYGITWTQRSDRTIPWTDIKDVDMLTVGRSQRYLVLWLSEPDRYPPRRQPRRPGPSLTNRMHGCDVHIPLGTLTVPWKVVWAAVEDHAPQREP